MKPFGKYQLIRRLAAGGMAEVFLATGPTPDPSEELLAIKLIHAHFAEDQAFMSMFLQEARLTAPLHHPNLVEIYDLGEVDGRLYLAMEFIRGHPLHTVLRKAADKGRAQGMPMGLACAVVRQAAAGLHCAHDAKGASGELLGLVHRDVSPQNLMLDQKGLVKVVDFGVAKATAMVDTTRKGQLKGKIGYMAPEQLKSLPLDRRADVFALGAVLYELCSGKPLYPGRSDAEILQNMMFRAHPDIRHVAPEIPPHLAKVIARAIEPEREKRYRSAAELGEALDEALAREQAASPRHLAKWMAELMPPLPVTLADARASAENSASAASKNMVFAANPASSLVAEPPPAARPPSGGAPVASAPAGGRARQPTLGPAKVPARPTAGAMPQAASTTEPNGVRLRPGQPGYRPSVPWPSGPVERPPIEALRGPPAALPQFGSDDSDGEDEEELTIRSASVDLRKVVDEVDGSMDEEGDSTQADLPAPARPGISAPLPPRPRSSVALPARPTRNERLSGQRPSISDEVGEKSVSEVSVSTVNDELPTRLPRRSRMPLVVAAGVGVVLLIVLAVLFGR